MPDVVSIGIGGEWGFEDGLVESTGCHVFAMDPTEELKARHEKHAAAFVNGVLRGGIRTQPVSGGRFRVEEVEAWDGLDGKLPEEEPLDAYDDEEVAFGA